MTNRKPSTSEVLTMPRGKPRSPEEIIAEKEAQLKTARLRLAKDQLKAVPAISALTVELEKYEDMEREAKKGFTESSPQSFSNRIQSHALWIEEIEAQQAYAEKVLDYAGEVKASLREAIADMSADLLDAKDQADPSFLNRAEAYIEGATEGAEAMTNAETLASEAQDARKAFTANRRPAPKAKEATA